nr:glutathione S-transferase D5-like [Megalopta genalis]
MQFLCTCTYRQYLSDKYDTDGKLYPKDAKTRAIVNHRLCFNLAMYYRNISEYVVRIQSIISLIILTDTLTIADFPLITATLCLEAIDFKLNQWPRIQKWYNNFKIKHPELWKIAESGMEKI